MMESIGMEVALPIIVHVDNVGTIFMSENVTATARTRHVDARYHFVREYVKDGYIKIQFVKTANNQSDGFTKNVNPDTNASHTQHYLAKKDWITMDSTMGT